MKTVTHFIFWLFILCFAGVTAATAATIRLANPVQKPVLDTAYFKSPCDSSGARSIICGDEFCDSASGYITRFRNSKDEYSFSYEYNLGAYMLFYSNDQDLCVDRSILENSKAGYHLGELDGVNFSGVLKIQSASSQDMYWVPFRTSLKKSDDDSVSEVAKYEFTISRVWNLWSIKDSPYFYAATWWLNFRKSMNHILRRQDGINFDQKVIRLPSSKLTLTLKLSSNLGTRVYDAEITGQIETPFHNKISIPFQASSIRFAKPGFTNFRKDIRYQRSVSFVPADIAEYYKMKNEPFRIIEIVLIPGE